jgi:hypothetical protein
MNKALELSKDKIYYHVQLNPLNLSIREIVQLFDRSRMDPRLMEIMTEFLRDFWWTLDPTLLNRAARKAKFSFMIKAALILILHHCQILESDKQDFVNWFQQAIRGIKNPAQQLMYVGVFPIGSRALENEVNEALPVLFKHHIILKDLPFNKGQPGLLKSEKHPPEYRIDELSLLKLKWVHQIQKMKFQNNLKNEEIVQLAGINRVFLSRILNNKVGNISVEYLKIKAEQLAWQIEKLKARQFVGSRDFPGVIQHD